MAVLACLPGEQHDLGLIAFGLALRSRGWRIVYLGADTPIETVEEASGEVQPSLVVLAAVAGARVEPLLVSRCASSPAATAWRSPGPAVRSKTACSR